MAIDTLSYLLACIAGSGLIYGVVIYRSLVRLRSSVALAWRNVDGLIRQRNDALRRLGECGRQQRKCPEALLRLVDTFERSALSAGGADPGETTSDAEVQFRGLLADVREWVATRADLKDNSVVGSLLGQVSDTTGAMPGRIQFFNESVRQHNERMDRFPDWVVARVVGFGRATPV